MSSELDNPIWSSLRSRHRGLARCVGDAARYSPEVAPFLAVANSDVDVSEAIACLLAPNETVYLLGRMPSVQDGRTLVAYPPLAQMICEVPLPVVDGPDVIELTEVNRPDVLALTALVYPHYFRPRTMDMGRYFGIFMPDERGGARLAAMIGERLGTEAYTEMSAICTHPHFNGRGYARRLTAMLTNETLQRGRTPCLHVSHSNSRAKGMYERMGYRHRTDLGFWSLRRAG